MTCHHGCFQGGEPDLMTAAKMVLHDWQRGRIPFFVSPPRTDDSSEEKPNVNGVDVDAGVNSNQASAAFEAIANILSSQQKRSVPVQRDLFSENELEEETAEQLPNTLDNTHEEISTPNSDSSEQSPVQLGLDADEQVLSGES